MSKNFLRLMMMGLFFIISVVAKANDVTSIFVTANGFFDQAKKQITINVTQIDALDGTSHLINDFTIDKIEIFRSEAHGAYKLVQTFNSKINVVDSKPQTRIVWTDTNLPETTSSTLVEYMVYVSCEGLRSSGSIVSNSSSPYGGASFGIDYRNYPNKVSDLKITVAEDKASATVSFKAPTHGTAGKELTSLSTIIIYKYDFTSYTYKAAKKFLSTKAKPGAELSWTDTDVHDGDDLVYQVVAVIGSEETTLKSEAAEIKLRVGNDVPTGVLNLKAEAVDGGIKISWDAPKVGLNSGIIEKETLTYKIRRVIEKGMVVTLTENLKDTEYIDNDICENIAHYTYLVTAVNPLGVSGELNIEVKAGKPYTLPFTETISKTDNGITVFDNTGWEIVNSKNNSSSVWAAQTAIADNDKEEYIYGNGGMVTTLLYPTNTVKWDDFLTSADILLGNTTAVTVAFDYYAMAGYDNVIDVEVASDADGVFNNIGSISYANETKTGWKHASFDSNDFVNAESIKIRFVSHKGTHSNSIGIDNISVQELRSVNAIENVTSQVISSAAYNLQGQRINAANARGIIIIDGKKRLNR